MMRHKYIQKSDQMSENSNVNLFQVAEKFGFITTINYIDNKRIS